MHTAIGMIEVEGVAAIIVAADAAVKAGTVTLLGWESTGGFTTLFCEGPLSDVEAAVRAGEAAARELAGHVVACTLSRPEAACRAFVGTLPDPHIQVCTDALGLLEARGYGVHVRAHDAMVKAAAVRLAGVLTVHNRVVCTLVQGEVAAVQEAVAVGRSSMADYEHFMASAVLAQPDPAVLQAFAVPVTSAGAA